ncbi:MAG: hypothetical protein AAGB34_05935 [Planctomycetota bacterium]
MPAIPFRPVVTFALLSLSLSSIACSGDVYFSVHDSITGEPIEGVRVVSNVKASNETFLKAIRHDQIHQDTDVTDEFGHATVTLRNSNFVFIQFMTDEHRSLELYNALPLVKNDPGESYMEQYPMLQFEGPATYRVYLPPKDPFADYRISE